MRSRRCATAWKTLTVPTTLTRAPSGGSARQNGTWSAARWMTWVIAWSSNACSTAARSVMSPATNVTRANSSSPIISRRRCELPPKSKTTGCWPSRTSVRTTQAPMQPSAPVTRKRSFATISSSLFQMSENQERSPARAALPLYAIFRGSLLCLGRHALGLTKHLAAALLDRVDDRRTVLFPGLVQLRTVAGDDPGAALDDRLKCLIHHRLLAGHDDTDAVAIPDMRGVGLAGGDAVS